MKKNKRNIVADALKGFAHLELARSLFVIHFYYFRGCFDKDWMKAAND